MIKKSLMLLTLLLSIFNANASLMKSALLYVGPHNSAAAHPDEVGGDRWATWSRADIDRFDNTTNSFIILPTGGHSQDYQYANYHYLSDSNNPWITSELLPTPYGYPHNFVLYIEDVVKTMKAIYESRGTLNQTKIYISTPRYRNHHSSHRFYNSDALNDFFYILQARVIDEINGLFWHSKVAGFYIIEESFDTCTQVNTSGLCETDDDFTYFRDVRTKIDVMSPEKELIWAPHYNVQGDYYHNISTHPYKKLSELLKWQNANHTIFNRILMQPGFANKENADRDYGNREGYEFCKNCFSIVKDRVATQTINGVSAGNTKLGLVLELKGESANNQRYIQELFYLRNSADFTTYFSDWKFMIERCINPFYSFGNLASC